MIFDCIRSDKHQNAFEAAAGHPPIGKIATENPLPFITVGGVDIRQSIRAGQYFRKTRQMLIPVKQVMLFRFVNKEILLHVKSDYETQHQSNPFRGLGRNAGSEVLAGGDCIIYSKNRSYLFVFHDYIGITIRVRLRNRKNMERELESGTNPRRLCSRLKARHCQSGRLQTEWEGLAAGE